MTTTTMTTNLKMTTTTTTSTTSTTTTTTAAAATYFGNEFNEKMRPAGEDGERFALPAISSDSGSFVGESIVDANVVVRTIFRLHQNIVVAVQIKDFEVQTDTISWPT